MSARNISTAGGKQIPRFASEWQDFLGRYDHAERTELAADPLPAFVFYAVLERFAVFPSGNNLLDAGLPIADALDAIAGSNTVRRFAAI